MLTSKPSKVAKVVICGMRSVGKTAILEQLIYGTITPETVSKMIHFVGMHILMPPIIIYRSYIQQLKIRMSPVWTLAEDPETFYAFMTQLVYKALCRYFYGNYFVTSPSISIVLLLYLGSSVR